MLQQTCVILTVLLMSFLPALSYEVAHPLFFKGVSQRPFAISFALPASPLFLTESANRVNELGDWSVNVVRSLAEIVVNGPTAVVGEGADGKSPPPVATAIDNFREDVDFLDDVAGRSPQLTSPELAILLTTISLSALSPFFFNIKIIELLIPSLAALSASVGISAEYFGKVAVSNGKEFAALAIIAAAEAESILAEAERSSAVLPFCVGIATSASAIALVVPAILKEISEKRMAPIITEVYYICPIIAIVAAAASRLSAIESRRLAAKAISCSKTCSTTALVRTFSKKAVDFESGSETVHHTWRGVAIGMLPPPILAAFFPGALSTKTIVCAALAAAQSAYYMSVSEYHVSSATDIVALKARSAAVCDFYANQASRAGAILPFTSALAGFCAAASAAAVELLPFVTTIEQAVVALLFPSGAALFAAAAAVSKARCEVTNYSLLCTLIE